MGIIEEFKAIYKSKHPEGDYDKIERALEIAEEALGDKTRYNDVPFIYHSIGIARIMMDDIGQGTTSILSAILHDVVRINPSRLSQIEQEFGEKVKETLKGMNNISTIKTNSNDAQVEHFKELIVSYSTNPRIILLKLADRLEVMRNLQYFPETQREKKAWETLYIYSQIAHKLGLYGIKTEMENLSIKFLEPDEYAHIEQKLIENKQAQIEFIESFCAPIRKKLNMNRVDFEIKGRTKSIYSIWKKMRKQKISFDEVYDLSAIRIIIDTSIEAEKAMCWLCFSIVTDFYNPNPSRMRDWISIPKSNGYESLHTTVITDEGKWVEVQIRTKRMDELAECGIAAHWKYKGVKDDQKWLDRLREIIESVKIGSEILAFDTEIDATTKEVFVFTPNGDLRKLPMGATLLDFAYDIHSDLGNRCVGGVVNARNVTIRETLKNGDLAEIKTSKSQTPKIDWLNYVTTSKAKSRIKAYLRDLEAKQTEVIKDELERKIKNWKLNIQLDEAVNTLCRYYRLKTGAELYLQLEQEEISMLEAKEILTKFINKELSLRIPEERRIKEKDESKGHYVKDEVLIIDNDINNLKYNFAKCCNPIYGDTIKGFITILNGITIHQSDCLNIAHLESRYPYRILNAKWASEHKKGAFIAKLAIRSDINIEIENSLRDVAKDLNVVIRNIKNSGQGKINHCELQVEVPNKNVLNSFEYLVKNIHGIAKVIKL